MAGKFEIKKSANGKFHFNLKAGNGQIILSSEMYESKTASNQSRKMPETQIALTAERQKQVILISSSKPETDRKSAEAKLIRAVKTQWKTGSDQ